MDKDVERCLQKLEASFKGPNGLVGERVTLLDKKYEPEFGYHLSSKWKGFICVMDCLLDYYIYTFELLVNREKEIQQDKVFITTVHASTFWRLRSSYILFIKGYIIDALSLIRAIFENAMMLAGLGMGVITIDDVFGQLKSRDVAGISRENAEKKIYNNIRNTDKKLYKYLIGSKSGLKPENQRAISRFITLLHSAVHKSMLSITLNFTTWKDAQKLSLFPYFDEDQETMYMNSCFFASWMVLRTIPLLKVEDNEFGEEWANKYDLLNTAFKVHAVQFPKELGRAMEELIDKKYSL